MTVPHILPQRIRAENAVRRRQRIEGRLGLEQLERLRELAAGETGQLAARLDASADADGSWHVRGTLEGRLELVCERCAATYDWSFDIDVDWRLVESEAEEQRLLAECEPVLIEDDWLPVRQLIEDEVLLAVPVMPVCERNTCR